MRKSKLIGVLIIILVFFLVISYWFWKSPNTSLFSFSFNNQIQDRTITDNNNQVIEPKFNNYGPAPQFSGLQSWQNSEPLVLAELQGKVILVHFWTYSCINCIRSLPYLNKWYEQYQPSGLEIIGIHTPEFTFEKVNNNVQAAINRYSVKFPVAQDNNYATWKAFENQFWPALYLVDQNGNIVYTHFGEGDFNVTEKAIRILLGLEGEFTSPPVEIINKPQTPEIYFGKLRLNNFGGNEEPSNAEQIYVFPKNLAKNKFALEGRWRFEPEAVTHTQGFGKLRVNFNSSKINMVAQSRKPITLRIFVDGKLHKAVTVSGSDIYPLFDTTDGNTNYRLMEVEIPESGVQIFTMTFN